MKQEIKHKAKPKCPQCNIEGVEYISSVDSIEKSNSDESWFNVAFCNQCGYVYGIFNKIQLHPIVQYHNQKQK
ncbi:MAG: hypothetical protein PHV76_03830 [Bacteroidales bacterium]|nr:hypothetical protein [Bacteroidales bacterium]MDD4528965.1 hypothetical protein [Bacteroidales bacterium]